MKSVKLFLWISASCLLASPLFAGIYQWTDSEGIKHFTNNPPPASAEIVMETEEIPYDEAADIARMEAQRQEQLDLDHMALAQREAELLRREVETERRLAQSEREMEKTLKEAEDYLDSARDDQSLYRRYGYYPRYYGYSPYFKRWHYRNKFRHRYFKTWNHKDPHPHPLNSKAHLSPFKKAGHSKIHGKTHSGSHSYQSKQEKQSRSRHTYRGRHNVRRNSGFKR